MNGRFSILLVSTLILWTDVSLSAQQPPCFEFTRMVAHPGADGVIGQTELLGNDCVGKSFEKKGAQSTVATVQGLRGFEEETTTEGIVHDYTPTAISKIDAVEETTRKWGRPPKITLNHWQGPLFSP